MATAIHARNVGRWSGVWALAAVAWAASLANAITFKVTMSDKLATGPVSGRLVISLIREGAKLPEDATPNDAPFWDDFQPMFAMDVKDLAPGKSVIVDDKADAAIDPLSMLQPGNYRAQARLITVKKSSSWMKDPGNFLGKVVKFSAGPGATDEIAISLSEFTPGEAWTPREGVALVEIRSKLLSDFHHRDVMVRAAVVKPTDLDTAKKYAVVYEIPGFGGDHRDGNGVAERREKRAAAEQARKEKEKESKSKDKAAPTPKERLQEVDMVLDRNTIWVVLDPESPYGHTLFANSANNGPCGDALVKELIPEIEKRFPAMGTPQSRILRGHSSGGWATIWLTLNYPDMFGATWSTSPDPVDFRRLETVNIYEDENMYFSKKDGIAAERGSFRKNGEQIMTIRRENIGERMLGANQTSGQQWGSWQAVWGPRVGGTDGHPAALYDAKTGVIDREVAKAYKAYDIGALVRSDPAKYATPFFSKIRLAVGAQDNFYLNEAVELLARDLAGYAPSPGPAVKAAYPGYVRFVQGADHGTIFASQELKGFPAEMVAHLRGNDLIVKE